MSDTNRLTENLNEKQPVLIKLRKIKPVAGSSSIKRKRGCKEVTDEKSSTDQLRNVKSETNANVGETQKASTTGEIVCEFCDRILPNMSQAIHHKHVKHRLQGRNYFCEICGCLFPIRIALELHKQSSHQNRSDYKNSQVQIDLRDVETNTSNGKDSQSKLVNIKTENKAAFSCTFCVESFLSADALEMHEKQVHIFEKDMLEQIFIPPPSTKIRVNHNSEVYSVYYCYMCGSEYVMKYNLKKHIQSHHKIEDRIPPEEGVIRCTLCESIFYTKKAYDVHIAHHRPEDLYVINEEHRKQVVRVDQDFDYRRVPTNMDFRNSKRRRIEAKNKLGQNNKAKEEEPMTPPSAASESSDEDNCKGGEND